MSFDKWAWPLGVGLSFVAGGLVATSIQQEGSEQSWLYDYQTLITGILAVLAAFVTVNVMNRTDRAADKRHHDLLKIQTRPSQLIAERAVNYSMDDLNTCQYVLKENLERLEANAAAHLAKLYLGDFRGIITPLSKISTVINSESMQEAKQIMNGECYYFVSTLAEESKMVNQSIEDLWHDIYMSTEEQFEAEMIDPKGSFYGDFIKLKRELAIIVQALGQTTEALRNFARSYEVSR